MTSRHHTTPDVDAGWTMPNADGLALVVSNARVRRVLDLTGASCELIGYRLLGDAVRAHTPAPDGVVVGR